MADQSGTGATQADADGGSQNDGQSQVDSLLAGTTGTGAGGSESKTFDADYVQKVRSEAASWRTKAQQAQKRLDDMERGQMSELEKLKVDNEAITKERDTYREQARAAQVASAAGKAGAIYPDAVARLIPADAEDTEAALKEVRKQYPAMFRQGSADAGAGTNGKPLTNDMNDILRSAARRG